MKNIIDIAESPVFITGIERSGSSIIARIIKLCGGFTGVVTEMYENKKIKDYVDSYYTEQLLLQENGQFPLPITENINIPFNWKNDILNLLHSDTHESGQLWMYKSARIGQIWPVWHYAFPNAKWLIVRRRTGDIISSCAKTAFMTAFKNKENQRIVGANNEEEGWLWWVHEQEKKFVEMINNGVNCKVIWPERMVYGDYGQIYEMLEWVGLKWNDGIIRLVEPLLNKSRKKERSFYDTGSK